MSPTAPRTFVLNRHRDISGVSGTGLVAEGVVWSDGAVALRWPGDNPTTVAFETGIEGEGYSRSLRCHGGPLLRRASGRSHRERLRVPAVHGEAGPYLQSRWVVFGVRRGAAMYPLPRCLESLNQSDHPTYGGSPCNDCIAITASTS